MPLSQIVKLLLITGIVCIGIAGVIGLLIKMSISIGKLPGDIHLEGKKGSLNFPITSCILISVALTILINILMWFFKKGS